MASSTIRCFSLLLLLAVPFAISAAESLPDAVTVLRNGQRFTLPAGFELELAAGADLTPRPISADFDEQGRLYVTDSSGTNEPSAVQLEKKPHRILRLEDTNGDGVFDKRVVFAEQLMFPEGALWFGGSLYVAAPPSIWKFTDTNDDGVADQREEWFQGKTLTGCANDLHGPYLGRDGWIYWCKGAFAEQTYTIHGKPWKTKASHIFRCRPEGTGLEAVMTGGMDNPVDVVSLRNGERIFTTTFFQHPAGGRRDGLIHAIFGGVYGKDHAPVHDHPWTSPELMPVLAHLGPAAPCGLEVYDAAAFGAEFADNLFTAQFNLRKVSRHVLQPEGGSFRSRDEDFVVSEDVDFHPTDVLTDADGSLLIVDTGGWYKLCCPTSQFHRPESLGGIYRVRKKGAAVVIDPRGVKLKWQGCTAEELCERLSDSRFVVQRRGIHELGKLGDVAAEPLRNTVQTSKSPMARQNALWAAARLESPAGAAVVRAGLEANDAAVQQVALQVASLLRQETNADVIRPLLENVDPIVQRLAAECLGRMVDRAAVPKLLATGQAVTDRARDHALIYALLEIGDVEATARGLQSENATTRKRALTTLEHLPGKNLAFSDVQPALTAADAPLRETAWWLAQRHPEWGSELTAMLAQELTAVQTADAQQEFVQRLAKWAKTPAIQDLLTQQLQPEQAAKVPTAARVALQAMATAGVKETPAAWSAALARLLAQGPEELIASALAAVRALPMAKQPDGTLSAVLVHLASSPTGKEDIRLSAAAALPSGNRELNDADFQFLLSHSAAEKPTSQRTDAVEGLLRAKLTQPQLREIAIGLKGAGPLEFDRLLDVFQQSTADEIGLLVAKEFQAVATERGLRGEQLRSRLAKYGPPVQAAVTELTAKLNVDAEQQHQRLEALLAKLSSGDVRRGQAVYQRSKSACTACHAMAYVGGKVGPDLTRIGSIRTERDLLEAIIFPSASLVRSFESVTIVTNDGQTRNGLLRQETAEELTVVVAANREERIRKSDIDALKPSTVSLMPAGLDTQLTPQELIDLVTYLKACR